MTSMHHTPLPMYGLMKDSEQQRENGKLDRRDTPSNGPLPPPHSSPYSFKDPLYGGLKDSPFSSRDNYYGHKDERYARDERKAGTPHEGNSDTPLPPVLRNGSSPPSQSKSDYNHNPTSGGELDLSIRSSSASSVGTHPSMDSPHARAATPSTDTAPTHSSATLLWRSGYCQFCSRTFPSPAELEQHIQTEHLGGKDSGAKRSQPEPERNDDSDA